MVNVMTGQTPLPLVFSTSCQNVIDSRHSLHFFKFPACALHDNPLMDTTMYGFICLRKKPKASATATVIAIFNPHTVSVHLEWHLIASNRVHKAVWHVSPGVPRKRRGSTHNVPHVSSIYYLSVGLHTQMAFFKPIMPPKLFSVRCKEDPNCRNGLIRLAPKAVAFILP